MSAPSPSQIARAICTEVTPECPVEYTLYGYYPILGVNAFFAALFAICFIGQLFIGITRRTWTYMTVLSIGCFGEAVGYGGRVMMNSNPWNDAGFQMQICCLILAPSFLAAGLYVTLKHIVLYCGAEHSRLKPRLYPWLFISCDFGSIVLQAIGGGIATAARENPRLGDIGNAMILAGIAFQVVTMGICGILMIDYFWRFRRFQRAKSRSRTNFEMKSEYERAENPKATRNFRLFAYSIAFAFLTIFIRCIYRLPEMAGGWGNELMRKETEFLLLDGMMVAISCVIMTLVHPGYFFEPMRRFKK